MSNIIGPLPIDQGHIDALLKSCDEKYQRLIQRPDVKKILDVCRFNKDPIFVDFEYEAIYPYGESQNIYFFKANRKISNLDRDSPLGKIAYIFQECLKARGLEFNGLELRLERGCFKPLVSGWHTDGLGPQERNWEGFGYAFSACWSTIKNWSTYFIDESELMRRNAYLIVEKDNLNQNYELAESVKTPGKFGYLYDVRNFLHRAPNRGDIINTPVTHSDYRLFFRLTENSYLN